MEFLDDWFMKDLLQSWFLMWILVLAVLYGINASSFDQQKGARFLVVVCRWFRFAPITGFGTDDHQT